MGPTLSNIFTDDLDAGTQCSLTKFADDRKLGREADTLDGSAAIQRDLDRLEKWADGNLTQFSEGKCKVLYLGGNNRRHLHRLGAAQLESNWAEKDLGGPDGQAGHASNGPMWQ